MSASRDEFPKAFVAGKLTEYQYEKFTPRIWTPIFSLFEITLKPGNFLLQYYCLIVEYQICQRLHQGKGGRSPQLLYKPAYKRFG